MLLRYKVHGYRMIGESAYLHSTMLLLDPSVLKEKRADRSDLHSTMLLLYRKNFVTAILLYRIYIPLCFYFIVLWNYFAFIYFWFTFHYASTLSQKRFRSCLRGKQTYIPLCFYFIRIQSAFWLRWIEFTFHYASTLSELSATRHILYH